MDDRLSAERIAALVDWCDVPADDRVSETVRALIAERERLLAVAEAAESTLRTVDGYDVVLGPLESALDAWKAGRT